MPIIGLWYIAVLTISNKGITLKRFNKLIWSDITEAKKSKFLGFNTIYIKRKKGIPWHLPLYFVGNNTIRGALLENTPKNNPLYNVAFELPRT